MYENSALLGGEGSRRTVAGSEVAPQRLGHLPLGFATTDLVVNLPIVSVPAAQGLVVEIVGISAQHDTALALLDRL